MYAMIQASGRPSALADWNNNYADDPDKCVLFHCSNFPQELFGKKGVMDYQEIIAGTVGREKTLRHHGGPARAHGLHLLPGLHGRLRAAAIRAYVGEGEITRTPSHLRRLRRGADPPAAGPPAPHLLAAGSSTTWPSILRASPRSVEEAFSRYLGWDVYNHDRGAASPDGAQARALERGAMRGSGPARPDGKETDSVQGGKA